MRLSFERSARLPRILFWPAAAGATWAGLAAAIVLMGMAVGVSASPCWFRGLFGIPCPACGGTRALLAILEGRLLSAFAWNPLLAALLIIFPARLLVRVSLGRSFRLELSPRERKALPAAVVLLTVLDWIYLFARGA